MKITSYKHVLVTLALSGALTQVSIGQETRNMTLDEAVGIMLQQNWQLRMAEEQTKASKADVMKANSAFLPSVNVSETYTNTNDPMMAFGTKLKQSSITTADFNPDLLNDPDAIDNFATRVEVNQPIFNLDGIYGRKAAKVASEAAFSQQSWSQEQMILHTKVLYYNIVVAKQAKQTVDKAVLSAEENYKIAENLFDQGLITNADLMGVELHYTQVKSQALQVKHMVADLNQRFLQLMGSEENITIEPLDSIVITNVDVAALSAMQIGENRADLLAMEKAAKAGELNKKSQQTGFIPRINAFGSYELNDTQVFGDQADNYMVGVQLKWDLFQGGKQVGNIQKARHEAEIASIALQEKQAQAKRDVMRLINDLILAKEQVELAKLSARQAKEMHAIRTDRFAEGLEKSADLLMAETNALNRQLAYLKAKNNYTQLLFRLETELAQDLTSIQR
tara:strand:- start:848 stop:2200 length:1353 start_codon:yes stop_codon:yes gene_type:complete